MKINAKNDKKLILTAIQTVLIILTFILLATSVFELRKENWILYYRTKEDVKAVSYGWASMYGTQKATYSYSNYYDLCGSSDGSILFPLFLIAFSFTALINIIALSFLILGVYKKKLKSIEGSIKKVVTKGNKICNHYLLSIFHCLSFLFFVISSIVLFASQHDNPSGPWFREDYPYFRRFGYVHRYSPAACFFIVASLLLAILVIDIVRKRKSIEADASCGLSEITAESDAALDFATDGAEISNRENDEQPKESDTKNESVPINQEENGKGLDKFDEIKKYKELLDYGIITKEEFEKKKKELL